MSESNEGPVVLVTGATDGIGKHTALRLVQLGARVIVHGRTPERVAAAAAAIAKESGKPVAAQVVADLTSMKAVRKMAANLPTDRLDVLINNAGTFMREREVTEDGFEVTFAVNYLAPFLLTHLLLPRLRESASGRVVNVSSVAHVRCRIDWNDLQGARLFDDYQAYATSKLALVLFTADLARRLGPGRLTVNALHPGIVSTKLLKQGFGVEGPDSLEKGSATSVHLALSTDGGTVTGKYFADGRPSRAHPLAGDPLTSAKFYETTIAMLGMTGLPRAAQPRSLSS